MKAQLISGKTGLVPGPQASCGCGDVPCGSTGIQTACNPTGYSPTTY